MDKKGGSQIDWAISLGIFLIYLAWFFLFVRPIVPSQVGFESGLDLLQDQTEDEVYWTIYKVPLIIKSNVSGSFPVIVNDLIGYGDFVGMNNIEIVEDQGRTFFIKSLSSSNYYDYLYGSSYNYTDKWNTSFVVNEEFVSTEGMTVEFGSGRVDNVTFNGIRRIRDFDLYVGNAKVDEAYHSYSSSRFFSKHFLKYFVNHTTHVFDGFPWIYGFVDGNGSVKLKFNLDDYSLYYINPTSSGSVSSNSTECLEFNSNYISISDFTDSILFVVEDYDSINISFCGGTTNFDLYFDVDFTNSFSYRTLFLTKTQNASYYVDPFSVNLGYPFEVKGINEDKLFNLTNRSYTEAKDVLNVEDRDFMIEFDTYNVNYKVGANASFLGNIKSREVNSKVINEYGVKKNATIYYVTL